MRVAYFDCSAGVAGDMLLGALLDAGLPLERLRESLCALPLEGYVLRAERSSRSGVSGTHAVVDVQQPQTARHLRDLLALLDRSTLPSRVRDRAAAAFRRLAAAEAQVHSMPVEKVHFHEVGAVDSIVDIVGVLAGVELLGIERFHTSALALGRGRVQTAHGSLPVPAPATAILAQGLPVAIPEADGELTTPTGALLIALLAGSGEPPPAFRLDATGVGLGTRDTPGWPNVCRLFLGEADAPRSEDGVARRPVAVLETTVDDMTPEWLGPLPERLLAAGALDCTLEPVMLKKGRPGHRVVVIARPERADELAALLFRETTTLGIRMRLEERLELSRGLVEVQTSLGPVRMKVSRLPGGDLRAHPEYEDCRRLAERTGRPLIEVVEAAREGWVAAGRPLGQRT